MTGKTYPPFPPKTRLGFDAEEGVEIMGYEEIDLMDYVDADRAQRKPLTVDEAVALYRSWDFGLMDDEAYAVIRAVEAAHGIHERKESGDV